jgi:hypothetical protein
MLPFPAEIEREASRLGACAEAGVVVESVFVRPPVIVNDALAQMKAVAQGGPLVPRRLVYILSNSVCGWKNTVARSRSGSISCRTAR